MKKASLLFGILLLSLALLVLGCGIPQEDYDNAVSQLNTAQNELQSVKNELASTQSEVSDLTLDLEKSQNELQSVKDILASAQSEISELTSNLEKNQNDLVLTQDELKDTKEKLATIENVYPPREFSSATELKEWLRTNNISERSTSPNAESLYAKALELQEDALNNGYIISVDVDTSETMDVYYISCVTCINGYLWAWDPENDEPVEFSSLYGWTKIK